MPSLWQQIKKLFQTAEQSNISQPVVKSVIKRSEEEQSDYESWKNGLSKHQLLNWLQSEYVNYLVNPVEVNSSFDFIDIRATRGFAIHFYELNYPHRDINHLFDFLKEQVRKVGYRPYTSNSRIYQGANWVERLDRHYLKPPILSREKGEQIDQKYGNITIELLFRNDKAHQLKFSATSYNDRNYKEAESFDALMQAIQG